MGGRLCHHTKAGEGPRRDDGAFISSSLSLSDVGSRCSSSRRKLFSVGDHAGGPPSGTNADGVTKDGGGAEGVTVVAFQKRRPSTGVAVGAGAAVESCGVEVRPVIALAPLL